MSSLLRFHSFPTLESAASVVGKLEKEGPLGSLFDLHDPTDRFGKETWEQAEAEMQRLAFNTALSKVSCSYEQVGALFAGDLINQCTSSAYGLLDYDIPFFGLYGACSTGAEGLILAALTLDAGAFQKVGVVTSSHNCSAERQFRLPIEYGGQRTPTSQWTVTGAAAFLLAKDGKEKGPYLTEAMPGRTLDPGIRDANNMGAAMAPAAADTLCRYFMESGHKPSDFDGIYTGDLGFEGSSILRDLMTEGGFPLPDTYTDCGLLIFDRKKQDVHAGGSGCGCSTTVLAAKLLPELRQGKLRDILWIGTGALMSPMLLQQGQSIPGIAHLLRITSVSALSDIGKSQSL